MSGATTPPPSDRPREGDEAAVLTAISDIARRHLGWHGPISTEQRLAESLGLDSVRFLTLVVELEDRFRICLNEEDEAGLATVGDLVDLVRRKCDRSSPDAR